MASVYFYYFQATTWGLEMIDDSPGFHYKQPVACNLQLPFLPPVNKSQVLDLKALATMTLNLFMVSLSKLLVLMRKPAQRKKKMGRSKLQNHKYTARKMVPNCEVSFVRCGELGACSKAIFDHHVLVRCGKHPCSAWTFPSSRSQHWVSPSRLQRRDNPQCAQRFSPKHWAYATNLGYSCYQAEMHKYV